MNRVAYFRLSRLPVHWHAPLLALVLSACQTLPMFPQPAPPAYRPRLDGSANHAFELSADQQLIGDLTSLESREADTLSDIARHFGLGYNDVALANPQLDPWALTEGQHVLLPLRFIVPDAPRKGIVLNLAAMRLFYFPKSAAQTVQTYPVGIGRDGWNTPLGLTQIVAKRANPDWTVPESIQREHQQLGDPLPKVIRSGPDNPLGYFAMPLGFSGYLIHGTNKPYGIGMQVSHGCVQLYPEDVESLFNAVEVGTSVRIVHQPYLIARQGNTAYLEAHPVLEKWVDHRKTLEKEAHKKLQKLADDQGIAIDWSKVAAVLSAANGVPTPVSPQSPDFRELTAEAIAVQHPDQWQQLPPLSELTDYDWAIVADTFADEIAAQKFAAMLNHQGPPIPARKIAKNGKFQVIAGPFKSRQETQRIAKRLRMSFDVDASTIAPKSMTN